MKDMKRLIGITGILLVAYTLMSAALSPSGKPAVAASVNIGAEEDGGVFTAREEDDRIVILKGDRVVKRTDTRVSSLPKIDRLRLGEGIDFYSEKELKQFLEDYCS